MAETKELLRYSILCELKRQGFVYNKERDEIMTKDERILYDAANTYAYKLDTGDLNTNRDTFIAGAEWQKKQDIDKACEWLEEHLLDYWQQSVTDSANFINDFRSELGKI